MYHIKPDKRSAASADRIAQGLLTCLNTMPLKTITVSDLHRATGLSRATFYRLFDTIEDVLQYHFDCTLVDFARRSSRELPNGILALLKETVVLSMENHAFLKILVDNGRFDLVHRYIEQSFHLSGVEEKLQLNRWQPVERDYILAQFSMSIVAVLVAWERNGRSHSAAQVVEYLQHYAQIVEKLNGEG
ncbi:MAG: TetR/AcrR family transcriptional regulator [Faecalibacterium sp.]|nr:TetR/AcrR family transcriptional regulator [Faecalibacterium sp.]